MRLNSLKKRTSSAIWTKWSEIILNKIDTEKIHDQFSSYVFPSLGGNICFFKVVRNQSHFPLLEAWKFWNFPEIGRGSSLDIFHVAICNQCMELCVYIYLYLYTWVSIYTHICVCNLYFHMAIEDAQLLRILSPLFPFEGAKLAGERGIHWQDMPRPGSIDHR